MLFFLFEVVKQKKQRSLAPQGLGEEPAQGLEEVRASMEKLAG